MTEDELHLRHELAKWAKQYHGELPDIPRLTNLKADFARKLGFTALRRIVDEVTLACSQEILLNWDDPEHPTGEDLTQSYSKSKRRRNTGKNADQCHNLVRRHYNRRHRCH